ncbi:TlpA disulfide reductase family protein [Chitinophaga pinensis]|uniref:AhpC/TSA family protein n=1 Tax=Chitinophaga pinensis TaxID=79329 RepID=A0A5C6LMV0_9BACT|nr:TlpA disulfide reductase family protein [Chitinophaga pinensis]TWV94691.1 AhpC/TSA family protein [Chitinophaga pinensis]
MKTIKFILGTMCLLPLGLKAQNNFTVQGKIGPKAAPSIVFLNYYQEGKPVKDSVMLQQGQFIFKGKVNSPSEAIISVKEQDAKQVAGGDEITFYLENSKITISSMDSLWKATVKGSKTNDEQAALRLLQRPYRKVADSIMRVYNSWTPEQRKDTALTKTLAPPMRASQAGYDSVNRVFISSHLNSFIALRVFKELELGYDFNPDTAAVRFARFPARLRESYSGKKMAAMIEIGKKTNTGVVAMDFMQNDTTGKPVKLSDFRGRYVLVDFWASWCKPCRAENPNLLKAYNKFKDKNFTILGVSLDDEDGRKAWLHAVAKDGMPWTQVSDLQGFKSKAAIDYGINAIPANFLIAPDGKIIARNLRGDELEKKLAQVL